MTQVRGYKMDTTNRNRTLGTISPTQQHSSQQPEGLVHSNLQFWTFYSIQMCLRYPSIRDLNVENISYRDVETIVTFSERSVEVALETLRSDVSSSFTEEKRKLG